MSILDTLETIKSDLHQRETAAHTIRASALDGWAGINSDRTDRNGFVHGGDILGDISIISHTDAADTEKALIWKGVFRRNYYVSFSTCTNSNRLGQADERLVGIFNILPIHRSYIMEKTRGSGHGDKNPIMLSENL